MSVQTNDVLRVDVIGQFSDADLIVNSYHFSWVDAGVMSDANALDDMIDIVTALLTILKALHTADTVWRRIRVENLTQDRVMGEVAFPASIPGTASGDPGAPGVAVLAYFSTGVARRQLRKYWGPLAETHITSAGLFGGTGATVVLNSIAYLLDIPVTNGRQWLYGYRRPDTGVFLVPESGTYNPIPAYQRRRKQGRGV